MKSTRLLSAVRQVETFPVGKGGLHAYTRWLQKIEEQDKSGKENAMAALWLLWSFSHSETSCRLVAVTNSSPGYACNILKLWMTTFHLLCKHCQTERWRFSNNCCLFYKCRQIDNILQSTSVDLSAPFYTSCIHQHKLTVCWFCSYWGFTATIHMMLTWPPFSMCDNYDDNVESGK